MEQHSEPVQVFDFRKKESLTPRCIYALSKPVFFIGFMGAGKTSISRKLARISGVASVDLDKYIERNCDTKIKNIFSEQGEEAFRAIETDMLQRLANEEPRLISCGGGIVLKKENREIMRKSGYVIYLNVTAAEAAERISDTSSRPLFGDLVQAQRVIQERLPLYEDAASIQIDTIGQSTGALARDIFDILKKEGILWQPK